MERQGDDSSDTLAFPLPRTEHYISSSSACTVNASALSYSVFCYLSSFLSFLSMTTPVAPGEENFSFPLKVFVDTQKNRVLFVESNNDFVDVLLSILTLPLGTIVRLLNKHFGAEAPKLGSLTTLYEGLKNLSSDSFWSEAAKMMLVKPRNSLLEHCRRLKITVDDTEVAKYFICENWSCSRSAKGAPVSTYNTVRCTCGKSMNREIGFVSDVQAAVSSDCGVFATATASFIVTDDLRVMPNLAVLSMKLFHELGINHTNVIEERTWSVDSKEVMKLLMMALFSRTPLTDLILRNSPLGSMESNSEVGEHTPPQISSEDPRKLLLTVLRDKSTRKVLCAQADDNFTDFIFSFLAIPLGSAVALLGGNSSIGSIDNLYKSLLGLEVNSSVRSQEIKTMLLNPKLSSHYLSKCQIFQLLEETPPQLFVFSSTGTTGYLPTLPIAYLTTQKRACGSSRESCVPGILVNPKVEEGFVKDPSTFLVTDDLAVPHSALSSIVRILRKSQIHISSIEEHNLVVGLKEALILLKESLRSETALTNSFNVIMKYQIKQEITQQK